MEHIDIINRIVDAEHRAQQITNDAKEQLIGLPEEIRDETEKMHRDLRARAQRRVEIMEQIEKEATDELLKHLDEDLKRDIDAVNAAYQTNKDEWVEKLYCMIVGRKDGN